MELGLRVVRGPAWIWGNQDDGEGGVGTVVHIGNGERIPKGTVLVCWDTGQQANYRSGYSRLCDLRVLESAGAGIKHDNFTCDGCRATPICGIRWHCADCFNFNLCNVCYMKDVHNKNHTFSRFHKPGQEGVMVGKRANSTKIKAKGLYVGAKVVRGRDWCYGNQDGGNGKQGKVTEISSWQGVDRAGAKVQWGSDKKDLYRLGFQGQVDLKCVTSASGGCYYRDHLPVLREQVLTRSLSMGQGRDGRLKVGDKVIVQLEVDILKQMAQGHGGWVPDMERAIGKVGTVVKIDDDNDIHVSYGQLVTQTWVFHSEVLSKVVNIKAGDKVRVINNKETVISLQQGHGGWTEHMAEALGKEGRVLEVDSDGDAVVLVGARLWLFSPAALTLETAADGGGAGDATSGAEILASLLAEALLLGEGSGDVGDTLVNAASCGNLGKVKEILEANPDKVDYRRNGKTALHVACHQGKPDVVTYLLSKRANMEIKDEQDYTALHHAAYGDKTGKTVVLMLNANCQANPSDNKNKSTPLHLAVNQGNEAAVRVLIKSRHCDVNSQDAAGDTPLHDAISKGKDVIVDTLMTSQMLDVTVCNSKGFNPLHWACLKGNAHAVDKFVEKFPGSLDIPKEDGFTAVHLAALNDHLNIARSVLLSGHCGVDLRTNKGQTALSLAVSESYSDVIELLVEHGAAVNAEDNDGDTPLHVAVMGKSLASGLERIAALLGLDAGRQSSVDHKGAAIACFLAMRGADINYRNHQGKTPLDLCQDPKHVDLIRQFAREPGPAPARAVSFPPRRRPAPTPHVSVQGSSSASAPRAAMNYACNNPPRSPDVNRAQACDKEACIICSENTAAVVFHPCGHKITCSGCSVRIKRCLFCKTDIQKKTTPEGAPISGPLMSEREYATRLRALEGRLQEMEDDKQCTICMERDKRIVFLCGHGSCEECSRQLQDCHVCRQVIQNRIVVFS